MVEKLEFSLEINSKGDLLKRLEELKHMGEFVIHKGKVSLGVTHTSNDVYHIEGTTVVAHHNAAEPCYQNAPDPYQYYLELKVYGTLSEKLKNWLEEHKKLEEPEELS